MLNSIIIIGRVTKEPEVRKTQTGKSVTTIGVAVDRTKKKNSATGKYEDAGADFFSVQLWEKAAEYAENYAHKGTLVVAKGRMTSRQYQAKDGSNRIAWEITDVPQADGFSVLGQPGNNNGGNRNQQNGGYQNQPNGGYQQVPQAAPAQGYSAPQGNQQQYAPQTAPAQSSPSEFDPSDFFGDDPFGNSY